MIISEKKIFTDYSSSDGIQSAVNTRHWRVKGNGTFAVFSQYEKNHIIDARRSHFSAADSADEALAVVTNFEKYLLPDTAQVREQVAPMPRLRIR
jgi:hypothetical protein